ncbi:hypothetical protein AV530_017878 [Patagioenas fasciata monilis]|uniref:Uncharacterized protein n=1 Tax=Patagioenas fasciata monilis TaxID=372326 RepID=A0A1V4JW07_PATFA|nr:hypothetical protein AV530_017878 [Patagioenas fasciata monilis]
MGPKTIIPRITKRNVCTYTVTLLIKPRWKKSKPEKQNWRKRILADVIGWTRNGWHRRAVDRNKEDEKGL